MGGVFGVCSDNECVMDLFFGTVVEPLNETKMCAFLWMYYGFPTSDYEGINVEETRYRCGQNLANQDLISKTDVETDCIAGIPDSGTAHAIGYANQSKVPFSRPLIKYTPTWPRSFTPKEENVRNTISRMKLVPVRSLIQNKKLMFVDDSIVRGTQIRGIMDNLFSYGAKELHLRIACPPVLFNCKYLDFTRLSSKNETIARKSIIRLEGNDSLNNEQVFQYTIPETKQYRNMVEDIRKNFGLDTLKYHSLDSMLNSIDINKCKMCTYCWNGQE